jgi:hypothetical protein
MRFICLLTGALIAYAINITPLAVAVFCAGSAYHAHYLLNSSVGSNGEGIIISLLYKRTSSPTVSQISHEILVCFFSLKKYDVHKKVGYGLLVTLITFIFNFF